MKYHKFTQSGFKHIGIGRLKIVAKKTFWKKTFKKIVKNLK